MFTRAILAVVALLIAPTSIVGAAETIRFATWPEYGKNAGLVYAEATGVYAKYGLTTRLLDGYQNTITVIQAGEAEIAQILCSSAVKAISQGLPARIVAVRDQQNPIATISLPKSNIKSPYNYRGRRWGHSSGFSPERAMLTRLASQNGFDVSEIELVNVDFPARLPALLRGDVDFVSAWIGSGYPTLEMAARKAGQSLDLIKWQNFGVDTYGECYIS